MMHWWMNRAQMQIDIKKSDEQKVAEIFRCICFEQIKLQCNERSAAAVRTEEARNGWTDEMPIFPSIMSQMSLPK